MTELEYVEIEGFKGLEYVEFEPTDINLITGRNNTGKTSFLEALSLNCSPKEIERFNTDLSKVVNVHSDESKIRTKKSDLQIYYPPEQNTANYLTTALADLFAHSVHWQHTIYSFENDDTYPEWVEDERIENVFRDVASRTIRSAPRDLFPDLKKTCIILEIDGKSYPYVLLGNTKDELLSLAHEEMEQTLNENFEEFTVESSPRRLILKKGSRETERLTFDFGTGAISDGRFLTTPPSSEKIQRIDSGIDLVDVHQISKEENAIKIDDIGDYVKETELVDNLKTFNLDYLVLEEDGEKHNIPYDFMGDGFKSIVGLLWELIDDVENEIVLLEEPETHMHPGYVREVVYFLIDLAREEDVQLFITTHDSDFINDFFTENLTDEEEAYLEDEFSLLRMEEDGAVVEDYETARENLKDLHLDLRGI